MTDQRKIVLWLTSVGCPEQYDAKLDGVQVGYLRLRHGEFRVDYPECGGETIYRATPEGDGMFEDHERDYFLRFAVKAILDRIDAGAPLAQPQAPDVQYEFHGGHKGGWRA